MVSPEGRLYTRTRWENGCLVWTGAVTAAGYGELMVDRAMWYAHRYALHLAGVEIPSGMVTDHICCNRRCVRLTHLRVVTQAENILRGQSASARNARKVTCKRGHPFDSANTWVNGYGHRVCRECRRVREGRPTSVPQPTS